MSSILLAYQDQTYLVGSPLAHYATRLDLSNWATLRSIARGIPLKVL